MKVSAVIRSLPGFGEKKTELVMERIGIPDNRRVRGLGTSQRAELAAMFAPIDA